MCHNGEMVNHQYAPQSKDMVSFLEQYEECQQDISKVKQLVPMTMEGCVVRLSDIIGYIGKDIDDACRLGMFQTDKIPTAIKETLGVTNDKIMNAIILDVIENSFDKPYLQMSERVFEQVVNLKKFNYENIYAKATDSKTLKRYTEMFHSLFEIYMEALEKQEKDNDIFQVFLQGMCQAYVATTSHAQMVIDFMSGMTDNYIERQYIKYIKNAK